MAFQSDLPLRVQEPPYAPIPHLSVCTTPDHDESGPAISSSFPSFPYYMTLILLYHYHIIDGNLQEWCGHGSFRENPLVPTSSPTRFRTADEYVLVDIVRNYDSLRLQTGAQMPSFKISKGMRDHMNQKKKERSVANQKKIAWYW